MKDLLNKFESKEPEIVFNWNDPYTDAEGWVVINSLRGGAAGGGTRMRRGLDRNEVQSLAKTMEVKFTVSGPQIGGAKSGINFDPNHPKKDEVLQRWFNAVTPLLKNYYGTGGDLNIDEIHEVIPITQGFGLWHPQEGIVNGHFTPSESEKIQKLGQLRTGVSKVVEDVQYNFGLRKKYVVADMITGYGVAESVVHYYALNGQSVEGKKVLVQGWGNVASAAAAYLAQKKAKIVGIVDISGGIIDPNGLSSEKVISLFENKKGNKLDDNDLQPFEQVNEQIWDTEVDVFLPCAASRLVKQEHVDRMMNAGLEVIASGANVPFADKEIFYGPIMEYVDSKIAVIPDFIANCGMARVFAYLMGENVEISDASIFKDASQTILGSMQKITGNTHPKERMSERAYEIALKKLL
ncbi:MAG: amino acid dehydrogenase [Flavobacteriales bacterium]|nr:amino acid dehydrogenase [Flavobacteriales bacterium]